MIKNFIEKLAQIFFQLWYKIPQGIRFVLVGGYNTVFGYALFSLFYFFLGEAVHYSLILLIAYFIGIFNNFVLFKVFVFNTKGKWLKEMISTYLSYAFLYPLNLFLLFIGFDILGLSPYFAQAVIIVLMPLLTYIVLKRFAFSHKKK